MARKVGKLVHKAGKVEPDRYFADIRCTEDKCFEGSLARLVDIRESAVFVV
jgi:hypothetical protein